MNRAMRRTDRQLGHADALAILRNAQYGVLSTICPNQTPYGVPLNFALVEENILYMHCASAGGLKLDNLRANSKACFTVVESSQVQPELFSTCYRSAIAFGNIWIVEETAEKQHGIEAILDKYSPGYREKGMELIARTFTQFHILRFDIASLTGKARA
ncbi:MAG: pyridoxamine 5'-phosphate oxidase family protein [Deltaproteobacteria bacterium]|nr:pyridoxamine 5'-phosphate oxidase family protein [Deltaproteobacteria bacterium]